MNAPLAGLGSLVSNAGAFGRGALLMSVVVHGGIAAAFVGWGEPETSAVEAVPIAIVAVPAFALEDPAASTDRAAGATRDAPGIASTEARASLPSQPGRSAEALPAPATEPVPAVGEPQAPPDSVAIEPIATIAEAPPAKPAAPATVDAAPETAAPAVAQPAAAEPVAAPVAEPAPAIPAAQVPSEAATATQTASLASDDAGDVVENAAEPVFAPARFDVAALANPAPDYPYISRQRGEEGRVVLRVEVTTAGAVAHIAVAESSGHRRLDEAALETVSLWRFEPARIGDQPIATTVNVPVTFRLEN